MKMTCPACGSLSSLDALLGNEGAREAVMAALAMPAPLGKLMVQYLALFRPTLRPGSGQAPRQLSFDRVANLLNELLPMITAARIERGGRTWSAPQDYWTMALTEMIAKRDNLSLPLKSHGYLLAIIEGYSQKAEGKQEGQRENHLAGRTPAATPAAFKQNEAVLGKKDKPRSLMPAAVLAAAGIDKSTKGGNDGNS